MGDFPLSKIISLVSSYSRQSKNTLVRKTYKYCVNFATTTILKQIVDEDLSLNDNGNIETLKSTNLAWEQVLNLFMISCAKDFCSPDSLSILLTDGQSCIWITCWIAWILYSVIDACGGLMFPARSSFMLPVRPNFANKLLIAFFAIL